MPHALAYPVNANLPRITGWIAVAIVYLAAWIVFDRLAFPVQRDEADFWATTLQFSRDALPSVALLRDYGDLNTPLPFVFWGWLEHFWGGGIVVGRHLNFILSVAVVLFVVSGSPGREQHAALAAAGLLAFPYFLGTSTHLYTDIPMTFFVIAGVAFHLRRRYFFSAVALILAISTRQFAVAFALALLACELSNWRATGKRPTKALVSTTIAAASLLGWFAFFGDFGPATSLRSQNLDVTSTFVVHPSYGLFSLSLVGLYFVVPELLLFRGAGMRGAGLSWRDLGVAAALIVAFVAFPPILNQAPFPSFGYMDRLIRSLIGDPYRVALYCALAVLAVIRFLRERLPLLLICMNAAVLCKAHTAWEKYAIPVLVVLWYLKSRDEISGNVRAAPAH